MGNKWPTRVSVPSSILLHVCFHVCEGIGTDVCAYVCTPASAVSSSKHCPFIGWLVDFETKSLTGLKLTGSAWLAYQISLCLSLQPWDYKPMPHDRLIKFLKCRAEQPASCPLAASVLKICMGDAMSRAMGVNKSIGCNQKGPLYELELKSATVTRKYQGMEGPSMQYL